MGNVFYVVDPLLRYTRPYNTLPSGWILIFCPIVFLLTSKLFKSIYTNTKTLEQKILWRKNETNVLCVDLIYFIVMYWLQ